MTLWLKLHSEGTQCPIIFLFVFNTAFKQSCIYFFATKTGVDSSVWSASRNNITGLLAGQIQPLQLQEQKGAFSWRRENLQSQRKCLVCDGSIHQVWYEFKWNYEFMNSTEFETEAST